MLSTRTLGGIKPTIEKRLFEHTVHIFFGGFAPHTKKMENNEKLGKVKKKYVKGREKSTREQNWKSLNKF